MNENGTNAESGILHKFVKLWRGSPPRTRLLGWAYLGTASVAMGVQMYNDGKEALMDKRNGYKYNYISDEKAIQLGTWEKCGTKLMRSVFFPIMWLDSGLTLLILRMNPPPPPA